MSQRLEVEGTWERVESRYVWVDALGNLLGGLITAAIAAVPVYFATDGEWLWVGLVAGAVLVLTLITMVLSYNRTRAIGFMLREDDMLVTRGIMFRRLVAVPYGRLQIVDVEQGPLERIMGLKRVKLVTAAAASKVEVPGLNVQRADALRDHLISVAEDRRAGL